MTQPPEKKRTLLPALLLGAAFWVCFFVWASWLKGPNPASKPLTDEQRATLFEAEQKILDNEAKAATQRAADHRAGKWVPIENP